MSDFLTRFVPSEPRVKVPADTLSKYQGVLAEEILEMWSSLGWGPFGGGLLWLANPDPFIGLIDCWTPIVPSNSTVFLRDAFGNLYLTASKIIYVLNVHDGYCIRLVDDPNQLIEFLLVDAKYIRINLRERLFKSATRRLGPLGPEECFTFVPALCLGGKENIRNLSKVQMYVQIDILRQLHGFGT